ncbi:GIP [Symbiodinium sp. CCMP2592]|nr:GIP [Symbiodinium sp. CCMP2592]
MTEISRSKDGVPIWNGEASSFQEFEETAMIWEQSIAMNKRYLCGPKLLAELTGAAKRLVAGKRHDWVSHQGGVQELMRHLRACLGKPLVSDLTEHLNRYFKNSRRRPNESMNDYITRKCEVYLRACQALQRVTPHHGGKTSAAPTSHGTGGSRRSSWDSMATANGAEAATEVQAAAPTNEAQDDEDDPDQDGDDPWSQWRPEQSWWGNNQWWGSYYGSYNNYWSTSCEWSPPAWHTSSYDSRPPVPELIPDFVQGWYLLQDSGLDQGERNVILAALGGDFGLQKVAQELRNQWAGQDGQRRRDAGGRQSGFWGEAPGDEDETETYEDVEFDPEQELNDEEHAMWAGAEDEAQSALAAMDQAKRTLRAARARQHNVRLSRQYYRPQGRGNPGGGRGRGLGPRDDSQLTCLRCGKLGHRVANCPQPAQSAKVTESVDATSSFICYSDLEREEAYATGLSTTEAVRKGMAVIDGGKKHGHNGVSAVDLQDRPIFGFGNGSENQCASTVHLKIAANDSPGNLKVHCLDHGSVPLLLSVESLRKLGAIVDFAEDMICFRNLDAQKIVQVERSTTGHQLISMTEDLMTRARVAKAAVPSLREYLVADG